MQDKVPKGCSSELHNYAHAQVVYTTVVISLLYTVPSNIHGPVCLLHVQGCLIALDKSTQKVQKLKQNIQRYHISCARCFKFDATKALSAREVDQGNAICIPVCWWMVVLL